VSSSHTLDEVLCEDADIVLYRAHTSDGRVVLAKTLKARPTSAEYESLRREAEGARIAGSDVAAEPEGLTTLDGRPTLVLRDDGGVSLAQLLHTRLPLARFFPIALALIDAVTKIHARRLVHGDLRPSDILVLWSGRIELIGFGQSVAASPPPLVVRPPESTWPYLAPEQTWRLAIPVDQRADLYAIGIMLFEMLAGRRPFEARDMAGWFHAHCALAPPAVTTFVPDLPPILSQIVEKLLAKPPEARYQSATGLRHDLERCFESWKEHGQMIDAFPLGLGDAPPPLRVSARLHGRREEIYRLQLALDRIGRTRRVETIFISGPAGIGKTSLLESLRQAATAREAIVSFGTCQPASNAPCRALLDALDGMIRATLESSEESPDDLRRRLEEALGVNVPLLSALLPGLARVVGAQAAPSDVPVPEAKGRLLLALEQFIGAFSTANRPVVLVLDDLQWTDATTLEILDHWAAEPPTRPMLIVGAFRSGVVPPDHPLTRAVSRMIARGAATSEIVLAPLSADAVSAWISDLLQSSREDVASLAAVVSERTGRNPFFVARFMESLHESGRIRYSADIRKWRWNIDEVRAEPHADNVPELIVENIRALSPAAQNALGRFAAYGGHADLATLAIILGCSEEEALDRLADAFAARLIARVEIQVRFLHDRIQQVAYELLGERRAEVHLSIGRAFLARLSPAAIPERVFEVVRQFELALPLIDDPEERARVAGLELVAGRRAQTSTHFASAAEFLSQGIRLLSEEHWETHHDLAFGLYFALARSRFVTGERDAAGELGATLLARARTGSERAAVRGVRAEVHLLRGEFDDAVAECLDGLRALGVDMPAHPADEVVEAATSSVLERLVGRSAEAFTELPTAKDPDTRAVCDLISSLRPPAGHTDPNLLWLSAAIAVDRSLTYGNVSSSAIGYCTMALRLTMYGRYEEAFRLGKAAYSLARREENAAHRPRAGFTFAALLSYLSLPIRECIELLCQEMDAATSIGDQVFLGYLWRHLAGFRFFAGDPLADVADITANASAFAERIGYPMFRDHIASLGRLVDRLRDSSAVDPFAASALDERFGRSSSPLLRFNYHYHQLVARFILGDHEGAVRAAEIAETLTGSVVGFLEVPEVHFYAALTKAAAEVPDSDDAATRLSAIRAHHAVLRALDARPASTFGAREALLAAEIDRLTGNDLDAEHGYERAVRSARASAQIQIEAIASECAARFHRGRGMGTVADAYLVQAHGCYEAWGALRKAQSLARAFPFLAASPRATLELDGIVKAQHAISSALRLPELQTRLLDVAIEHAAAQRGCLLQVEGRSVKLAAKSGNGSAFGELDTLVDPLRVPISVCLAAIRLKKAVVIGDAIVDNPYSFDPYFAHPRVRSVLCLPIVRDDRVTALLYFENDLVAGAFSAPRLAVLDCIATQAAISLENARLYSRLEEENAERQKVEARLAENQRLFEEILDAMPSIVFVKDPAGRFVLINRAFEEILYSERSQLLGKTVYELFPKELADGFRMADLRALTEDRAIEVDENIPQQDGIHAYLTTKFPLRDAAGKPFALCGIATDITSRKRAAEELRRSLSLVEATIESTADGILVTALDGKIVRYNRRFVSMWGIPEAVVESADDRCAIDFVVDQLADPAAFVAKIDELYVDREAESFDTLLFKDGRVFERYCLPQRVADRVVGRVWSFRDVTQRVRAAEERSRLLAEEKCARTQAEEAVRVRDDFLSIASHELRTPLAGLALAVESLSTHLAEPINVDRLHRAATIAKRQIRRIVCLVDMLLDVSRIRSGKLTLSPTRIDLRTVVEDVSALLAGELSRSGNELVVHAPEPVIGTWDALRLEQVVTNLLTNATKFGRGLPITVEVAADGEHARLSVSDQGIGIPAERRARIFEPFTRIVSSRHYGGLGLGLHITKTIVDAHGGTLTVESEEGVGSTFTVVLPLGERTP
jgi:PAS domain S-box-containing protein